MPYPTVIHLIAEEFPKANLRFLLVGGFAVNHHGVSRNTDDVDILIRDEDYPSALKVLEPWGYREFHRQHSFARTRSDNLLFMIVDFMFVDSGTFEKMWTNSEDVKIESLTLRVPSVEHLIAMKLHALKNREVNPRFKDLGDVVELARVNRLDLKSPPYRELCLRFGSEGIYRMLVQWSEGMHDGRP